jgi:hypothetical protein
MFLNPRHIESLDAALGRGKELLRAPLTVTRICPASARAITNALLASQQRSRRRPRR